MASRPLPSRHGLAAATGARPRAGAPRLLGLLLAMWQRARTRRELARLDARLLRDIGISPADAARESARPPWEHR